MLGFLKRLFSPKPVQHCCIEGCTARAVYAATIRIVEGSDMSHGSVRAICAKESCLKTMKWTEKTEYIALTPIRQSILAHAPQTA